MTANHAHTPPEDWLHTEWIRSAAVTGKPIRGTTFDRWLAAIEAAAEQRGAVKALRSVATQMESTADTLSELWDHYMLPGDIIAWLRHRAAQIECDDGTH